MSQSQAAPKGEPSKGLMQRILDVVEKVGNKVPHPVIIFLVLILLVVVIAHLLYATGASVATEVIVPVSETDKPTVEYSESLYDTGTSVTYQTLAQKHYRIETRTVAAKSLLTSEGIRFVYASLIPSFMGFTAVGLMI